MQWWRQTGAIACLALLLAGTVFAAGAGIAPGAAPATIAETSLESERKTIAPGESFLVALRIGLPPGWHTYWKNPGDAGAPTTIQWELPQGFQIGSILWPYPSVFRTGPIASYGYADEAWLFSPITAPDVLEEGAVVPIKARAEYLVCSDICIPEESALSVTVTATAEPADDGGPRPEFAAATRTVPIPLDPPAGLSVDEETLTLRIAASALPERPSEALFFPATYGIIDHAAPQETNYGPEGLVLTMQRASLSPDPPETISGVLVVSNGDREHAFDLTAAYPQSAQQGRNAQQGDTP